MTTCHLTKLEVALDQLKKAHPKLKPADAALLASALTLTGRHALALYEGEQYVWPDDSARLTSAMLGHVRAVAEAVEANTPTKKSSKAAAEDDAVVIPVGLMPNLTAGEVVLEGRDDLKTQLSDLLHEGVEFVYSNTDIGWQWMLDHANWSTISEGDISRKVKARTQFTEGAVGVEMGTTSSKRRRSKAAAHPVEPETPVETPQTDATE